MLHLLQAQSLRRCVVTLLAALCLAALFAKTALYHRLAGWADDAQHRLLGPTLDMGEVVIVDIDEESIEALKETLGSWPYDRNVYAEVVRGLLARGASTIAFDVLFAEPRRGDAELADALNENIVLAAASFTHPVPRDANYLRQLASVALPPASGPTTSGTGIGLPMPSYRWPDVTLPISSFVEPGRARVGVISVRPDDDGTLRRVPLFHQAYGQLLPSLILATWASSQALSQSIATPGQISIKDRSFPVNPEGEVMLRYPSDLRGLTVIPFHHLLRASSSTSVMSVLDGDMTDKTVFIGSTSTLLGDYAHTPLGRLSGLMLSAIARQSLAQGNVMRPASWPMGWLLVLLALTPAALLCWRQDPLPPLGLALSTIMTALLPALLGMSLFSRGWHSDWLFAFVCGVVALLIIVGHGVIRMRDAQRRLFYERRAAEEANRLKGEFLAHMAHELRTPLSAIMGFNKINQLDNRLDAKQRIENSAIIARNCEHLLKLVNDNLDHAKIEAGQIEVLRRPESIEAVVADVISTLNPIAANKSLRLLARYDVPATTYVSIDAFRVRQVLLNLAGNALKFTEEGRIDILVRWRDALLDITVVDTGPGMERGLADKVFEPFQQGDNALTQRQIGTGLGLTIARSLVRLMGGDIQLDSWPGQGSRFRFWIPAPAADAPATAPVSIVTQLAPKLSGRVLLAEDDEDIRELMRRELLSVGVQVHAVRHGLEAVHAARQQSFDLILMDLEMPVMSGLEAAQVLREGGITLPLLAMTAHSQGPETEAALRVGFDAVLTKPISTQVLSHQLAQLLPATPSIPMQAPAMEAALGRRSS